ncbi:hypothetical protein ASJ81_04045 [Methanosarcina spelaei]|uniref:Uncharacterized protein n=1 Tax=Methanosarcina spelaei TaxID=1036679 RepID=A0A2A2HV37_9EURY|nr:hypothetical protein ASJ81_04045 [Methanosarcina spelaei]
MFIDSFYDASYEFKFNLKFTLVLSVREVCLELIFAAPLHSRKGPLKKPKVRREFENNRRNFDNLFP